MTTPEPTLSPDEEVRLLAGVDRQLERARELCAWWARASTHGGLVGRFPLGDVAPDNPESTPGGVLDASRGFGFFGVAPVDGAERPVMGNYQEMVYDLPKTAGGDPAATAEWVRAQVREFVLRYFLRVSAFPRPRAVPGGVGRGGFAYSQHYARRPGEPPARVPARARRAIVDLRRLGRGLDWVVARVRIHDFGFEVRPFGARGPRLGVPLTGESFLALGPNLVLDEDRPAPGLLGRYGLGYAFLGDPRPGLLAYGPGRFDAAVQLIRFLVLDGGQVRVAMVFVSDRPRRLVGVELAPVVWGWRMADLMSFGLGGHLARAATEALHREFLERHFVQHHEAVAGTLPAWRRVADWLDRDALPAWVPRQEVP